MDMDLVTTPGTAVRYKTTEAGLDIYVDVWAPASATTVEGNTGAPGVYPALVFYHGGALAFGSRNAFTPAWIHKRITELGYLFISVDYRLLPSSTGHEVLEDVQDVWKFVTDPERVFELPEGKFRVDVERVAVTGSSAGGLCAYFSAIHCQNPKPRAVLSIYGMGGDIFTSYFLAPKSEAFAMSGTFFDAAEYPNYFYPFDEETFNVEEADVPLKAGSDGVITTSRFVAAWLYLQQGIWLDYLTGEHQPSLSESLRKVCGFEDAVSPNSPTRTISNDPVLLRKAIEAIPERHHELIPQLNVSAEWPPVFFLHGTKDTAVPVLESENLARLVREAGGEAQIVKVEGVEHNFDFGYQAPVKYKKELDAAVEFIERHVRA